MVHMEQGEIYKGSKVLGSSDSRPKLNGSLNSQDRESLCFVKNSDKGIIHKERSLSVCHS